MRLAASHTFHQDPSKLALWVYLSIVSLLMNWILNYADYGVHSYTMAILHFLGGLLVKRKIIFMRSKYHLTNHNPHFLVVHMKLEYIQFPEVENTLHGPMNNGELL